MSSLAWDEPSWLADATRWIDAHVARSGQVELVRTNPWSAIMRVPTATGDMWFKEVPPALAFEPALTALLAARRPDCLPEVVASESARLLTRDSGPRLRAVLDAGDTAPTWDEILPLYAELQIDFAQDVAAALSLGTPDDQPKYLTERYEELAGRNELYDAVQQASAAIDATIPPSVVHMEAHDGNIFVRNGEPVFIDWGEAVVTHPFLGPLLALRSATDRLGYAHGSPDVERLRDLYLEPFTRFAPMPALREGFRHGYLLAAVCRADQWHRTLAPLPRSVTDHYEDPVAGWLQILSELVDRTTTLGGA